MFNREKYLIQNGGVYRVKDSNSQLQWFMQARDVAGMRETPL